MTDPAETISDPPDSTLLQVPIAAVIAADEPVAGAPTLTAVFGDNYLYRHHTAYRLVRNALIESGYVLTAADAARYLSFPMVMLDELLRTRRIQAVDNAWAFREMDQRRPGHFTVGDLRQFGPVGNYLTHEAGHVIAEKVIGEHFAIEGITEQQSLALRLLLSESFAVACDQALVMRKDQPLLMQAFIGFNSYWHTPEPEVFVAAQAVCSALGAAVMYRYLILANLVTNFGFAAATEEHGAKLANLLELGSKVDAVREPLADLFRFAMKLNKGFTVLTTRIYLRLHHFQTDVEHALDICPLDVAANSPRIRQIAQKLGDFLGAAHNVAVTVAIQQGTADFAPRCTVSVASGATWDSLAT